MIRSIFSITLILIFSASSTFSQGENLKLGLPFGHNTPIGSLSFSKNGKFLVSSTKDELQLRLWDVSKGKVLFTSKTLKNLLVPKGAETEETDTIYNVEISPNGAFVYINHEILWNTHSGKLSRVEFGSLKRFINENTMLTSLGIVELNPDDSHLVHRTENSVTDVTLFNGNFIAANYSMNSLEGRSKNPSIYITDLSTGEILWELEGPGLNDEYDLRIFGSESGKRILKFDHQKPVLYLNVSRAFFDKSKPWYSGTIDVDTRELPKPIRKKASYNLATKRLNTTDVEIPNEVRTGKISFSSIMKYAMDLGIEKDSIAKGALAFSISNLNLAAGLINGDILIWDLRRKKLLNRLQSKIVAGLLYFENDSTLNHVNSGLQWKSGRLNVIPDVHFNKKRKLQWNMSSGKISELPISVLAKSYISGVSDYSDDPKLNAAYLGKLKREYPTFRARNRSAIVNVFFDGVEANFMYIDLNSEINKPLNDIKITPNFFPFLRFSNNNKFLYYTTEDYRIMIYDLINFRFIGELGNHEALILMLNISPDGRWLVSSSINGENKLFDLKQLEEKATISFLNNDEWVVVSETGLFDASDKAMDLMYYVFDNREIIDLEQMKSRFWEPGLLQKIMGYNSEELTDISSFGKLKIYPDLTAEIIGDNLEYQAFPREGGLGKISMWVNDKMVEEDINVNRSKNRLFIPLANYKRYMLSGYKNKITLRAYNQEGWLPGQAVNLDYQYGGTSARGDVVDIDLGTRVGDVKVYGLFVGTNDYKGDDLDLKFADEDAEAMYNAVQASASALWGSKNLKLNLLNTDIAVSQISPSKRNIKRIFEEDFIDAKPTDILFVYFSGHGVAHNSGSDGQSVFYYLTKDAGSFDMSDSDARANYTISSEELESWIGLSPALYQVLVIDACNSGTVVSNINPGVKATSADQIKAMDRMKDRTGMNIIVGSAADKVSFEASEFGQGLLTYSLLFGMQKAALREDKFVDIGRLFNYASDQVPVFAKGMNKIQQPQLLLGASFDLGIVDENVTIQVGAKKPVFIRSNFQSKEYFLDELKVAKAVDQFLNGVSSSGGEILFVDADEYKGAYKIVARYFAGLGKINVQGKFFRGDIFLGDFNVTGGDPTDLQNLAGRILNKVLPLMEKD